MKSSFVLAGMIKDGNNSDTVHTTQMVQHLMKQITFFKSCFDLVEVVIVCNRDHIYAHLLDVQRTNTNMTTFHLILTPDTNYTENRGTQHTYNRERFIKMAALRNL